MYTGSTAHRWYIRFLDPVKGKCRNPMRRIPTRPTFVPWLTAAVEIIIWARTVGSAMSMSTGRVSGTTAFVSGVMSSRVGERCWMRPNGWAGGPCNGCFIAQNPTSCTPSADGSPLEQVRWCRAFMSGFRPRTLLDAISKIDFPGLCIREPPESDNGRSGAQVEWVQNFRHLHFQPWQPWPNRSRTFQ